MADTVYNKVTVGNEVLIDLDSDTVASASDIRKDCIGHLNTGEVVTGTLEPGGESAEHPVGGSLAAGTCTSYVIDPIATTIRPYAFYGCDTITSWDIPSSVTTIGAYAFGFIQDQAEISILNVDTIDISSFAQTYGNEKIISAKNGVKVVITVDRMEYPTTNGALITVNGHNYFAYSNAEYVYIMSNNNGTWFSSLYSKRLSITSTWGVTFTATLDESNQIKDFTITW